ncbi:MAG: hypothetical protein ACKO5E_13335, partial [bacterium]
MEEILSFSEDLTSKRWNMSTLSPLANGLKLEDWATSVASTKDIVAIATFHGGISVYKWGKVPSLLWQKKPGNLQAGSPESLKPQLFRNSVLGTPSPRVVTSGQENEVTLSAAGIENAMKISIFPDDIKVITSKSTKPNSLTLRLNIPKRNHFDVARIIVATPFGITLEQPIGILPDSSTIIKSDSTKVKTITTASRQVIQATIEKAGEVARLKITPEKGKSFTVSSLAKRIGSTIAPVITLKSSDGNVIGQYREKNGIDPAFSIIPKDHSPITMEISDSVFS